VAQHANSHVQTVAIFCSQ